jgi:hypothetical protein
MLTFRRLAASCFVGLAMLAVSARGAEVDKFLPDKTDSVLTINVKQALHSYLVKKYGLDPLKKAMNEWSDMQALLETMGIDLFQDIDRVVAASAADGDKDHNVVVVHGRFDTAKFREGAKALALSKSDLVKVHNEGERRFYEVVAPDHHGSLLFGWGEKLQPSGALTPVFAAQSKASPLDLSGSFFFGLVDKGTVVFASDKQGMLNVFDRAAGQKKPSLSKWMRRAIEETDAKQSLWVVLGSIPHGDTAAAGEEAQEDNEPPLLRHATGGLTIADDIKVHITLTGVSVDTAKEMMEDLDDAYTRAEGLADLLAGNQKDCACLKDIPKAFKAMRKGKTITVEGQLDGDLLEEVIGLLQKAQEDAR